MNVETGSSNQLCFEPRIEDKNILLELIQELCDENGNLPVNLKTKVLKLICDCDLKRHTSLHKINTCEESSSTLLGLMQKTSVELTFEEQTVLNQAIIHLIEKKLPPLTVELKKIAPETLNHCGTEIKDEQIKELTDNIDGKLNILKKQDDERVSLMMEWINHRLSDVVEFSDSSSELYKIKCRSLEVKSKILHLQILQGIFTETNESIKSYREIQKDLKSSIEDSQKRIEEYNKIIKDDY